MVVDETVLETMDLAYVVVPSGVARAIVIALPSLQLM
jgi:hypothetical protein